MFSASLTDDYAQVPFSSEELKRAFYDPELYKLLKTKEVVDAFLGRIVATIVYFEREKQNLAKQLAESKLTQKGQVEVYTHPRNILPYINREELFAFLGGELEAIYKTYKDILEAAGVEI